MLTDLTPSMPSRTPIEPPLPSYCNYDVCERGPSGLHFCVEGCDEEAYYSALLGLVDCIIDCVKNDIIISRIYFEDGLDIG